MVRIIISRCLTAAGLFSSSLAFSSTVKSPGEDAPLPTLVADHPTREVLVERFARPPETAGILKIIHSWPDSPSAQTNLIHRLRQQGFGGVVCNLSFENYLSSDTKWAAFENAVHAAKEAGMALWLYDERGYPSGNAGGQVLKGHPEWQARGLLIADGKVSGGPVTLTVPPGALRLAAAFPLRKGKIDLSERHDLSAQIVNGELNWPAPTGSWQVMVVTENPLFEGTHAALNLADKIPYINLLQPEPTARFLELTHQSYAAHLGDPLDRWFTSTFTDEPSLMSLFLRPMPYRVLPWSENLRVAWEKRTGRSWTEWLPALVADAGSDGMKARYQFWQTVGDLVSENYFGQIQSWCARHHVLSGGHLLMEEDTAGHTGLYGNFFQCLRRLDAPSIDCLTSLPSEVPWRIARLAASAAELSGKSVVMCEASDHVQVYRGPTDQRPKRTVSEPEIRGSLNRLAAGGINVFTSYYSFTGLDDSALARLNAYVARVCSFLTGGHSAAEIAVVYPAESLWVHHVPARHGSTDGVQAGEIGHVFRAVSESLYQAGHEFTYVDSRALAESRVERGWLVHGDLRWRVVVLPSIDTLPQSAWRNLERFVERGGILLTCGLTPRNSEKAFPSKAVTKLADWNLGQTDLLPNLVKLRGGGLGIYLPADLASKAGSVLAETLEPAVITTPNRSPIRFAHRRIGGSEVFFVFNDSPQAWAGQVSLSAEGAGECWDPLLGTGQPVASARALPLQVEPYGSRLVRFSQARASRRLAAERLPFGPTTRRELPAVQPTVQCGEFVQPDLAAVSATNSAGASWRARGILKKSAVDTFLFASFNYAAPIDLSTAEAIVFDATIAENQTCSAQLLVILREEQGGDFLAASTRALSVGGPATIMLPLDQFQLAGWSKDADGQLDPRRIKEIRIGWGGYLGKEKETVEFQTSRPQAVGR